jgi:hypothetical protein
MASASFIVLNAFLPILATPLRQTFARDSQPSMYIRVELPSI